jgi:hypothetical protein
MNCCQPMLCVVFRRLSQRPAALSTAMKPARCRIAIDAQAVGYRDGITENTVAIRPEELQGKAVGVDSATFTTGAYDVVRGVLVCRSSVGPMPPTSPKGATGCLRILLSMPARKPVGAVPADGYSLHYRKTLLIADGNAAKFNERRQTKPEPRNARPYAAALLDEIEYSAGSWARRCWASVLIQFASVKRRAGSRG